MLEHHLYVSGLALQITNIKSAGDISDMLTNITSFTLVSYRDLQVVDHKEA